MDPRSDFSGLPRRAFDRSRPYAASLLKWGFWAGVIGVSFGAIGAAFHHCVDHATHWRTEHPWLMLLLPVAGLIIVKLYEAAGFHEQHPGTNLVLEGGRDAKPVPLRLAPLIFISTTLTHLCGGSSGREGAALQLGGSMASRLGRALGFGDEDVQTMTRCGMSAVFSALFGTPLTAAVFCIEVTDVGILVDSALLPCLFSALAAFWTAGRLGVAPTRLTIADPGTALMNPVRVLLLALACALAAELFCWAMHTAEHLYARFLTHPYRRITVASLLVLALSGLLHLAGQGWAYNGAGMDVIVGAVEQGVCPSPFAFLFKILLTALTLAAGFKGGEIVPSFFIGATLGCTLAPILGLEPGFAAAVGMVSVFCSVVNCPIASILLAIELFSYKGAVLFALAVAVSFVGSGQCSLYAVQRFARPKVQGRVPHDHH